METKKNASVSRAGLVRGRVQGVGFRFFAVRAAEAEGVTGWVRNLDNGAVEYFAQGAPDRVEAFLDRLRRGPGYAEVDEVTVREESGDAGLRGFEIRY